MYLKIIFRFLISLIVFISQYSEAQNPYHNVALGKKTEASSINSEYPISNIVDGKISRESKWMSATDKPPHVVQINLKKYHDIDEIRLHSGILENERTATEQNQADGFWSVKNFQIQYWDDANWTDFPNGSVLENRQTTAVFQFENPIRTYQIRVVADDGEQISIMEIEAFGTLASDMPNPPSIDSSITKQVEPTEDQNATLKINNKVVGKSFKYVGYNQGYFLPGYNVPGWLEYSNVNSIRIWASLNSYVPEEFVQQDESLVTVEEFDQRKATLRQNPENNEFIKWDNLKVIFKTPDISSTNSMELDYALLESKRLGIEPLLQINSRDFDEKWSTKWQQWQRYYALAYHAAAVGDAEMFAMQNEPNHRHSGPMDLNIWIEGMQIVSDAVHSAIEDVNKNYNKNLKARFVGPVTAGQNTDWWATIAKNIRKDYHGKTLDRDLIDIFSTHSYNSPAAGYSTRVDNIRELLVNNHPEHQEIPIVFTEIGRWMNAYLIDKEETMDSPSLFTEWAGIYSNNMKNGAYGMWAFKLVNNTSSSYPRGIKSGHHLTWQGSRFVEDAHQNLASGATVSAFSKAESASKITDGNKSDESAWESMDEASEKWIEIDLGKLTELGSAVIYTGSEGGIFTAPDRIRNFKLQSWDGNTWKDIPGTSQMDNRYAQVYLPFEKPVTTSRVRFISPDEGSLKIREIKLFGKDGLPNETLNYNISGIQRTGQVVRLFAKGFKDERNLLEVDRAVEDNGLDTQVSFDAQTGTYYLWLVQRGNFAYKLDIDVSDLEVPNGSPIVAERVDANYFGNVAELKQFKKGKNIDLTLPPQSVTLLSIPSGFVKKETIKTKSDAYVSGGQYQSKNFGSSKELKVSLNASSPDQNAVSYISFNVPKNKEDIKKAIFNVTGKVDSGTDLFRTHVYVIPNQSVDEKKLTWNNAQYLDKNEALINEVGDKVKVAGEIGFTNEEKTHQLDITAIVRNNNADSITFVVVRETRELGDDADSGRNVFIKSKESNNPSSLTIWE